jgi:hypothetical protein
MRIASLSYGSSLAYPHRQYVGMRWKHDLLAMVLEYVHPDNLGPLPPSPDVVAHKARIMGLATRDELYVAVYR